MLIYTALSILIVIYITWTSINGWAYRKPWRLLVSGLLVAIFATMIKSLPIVWKPFAKSALVSVELDFAAGLVDPTLIGLAGGLIASAVMLKVQIMHAADLDGAKDNLMRTLEFMQHVGRADDDLKLVARSLSNEEFLTRLKQIKKLKLEAILDHHEAKAELKKMNIPGLSGDGSS